MNIGSNEIKIGDGLEASLDFEQQYNKALLGVDCGNFVFPLPEEFNFNGVLARIGFKKASGSDSFRHNLTLTIYPRIHIVDKRKILSSENGIQLVSFRCHYDQDDHFTIENYDEVKKEITRIADAVLVDVGTRAIIDIFENGDSRCRGSFYREPDMYILSCTECGNHQPLINAIYYPGDDYPDGCFFDEREDIRKRQCVQCEKINGLEQQPYWYKGNSKQIWRLAEEIETEEIDLPEKICQGHDFVKPETIDDINQRYSYLSVEEFRVIIPLLLENSRTTIEFQISNSSESELLDSHQIGKKLEEVRKSHRIMLDATIGFLENNPLIFVGVSKEFLDGKVTMSSYNDPFIFIQERKGFKFELPKGQEEIKRKIRNVKVGMKSGKKIFATMIRLYQKSNSE
jgi:hypothetical protein